MPRSLAAGLVGIALVAGAAACVPKPPPPPEPPPPDCRDTPTGGEPLGSVRYLEPVFEDVAVACDIPYGEALDEDGEMQTLTLDVYAPVGDTATGRPVVLWLTHGGFVTTDKGGSHPEWATRLARRGYVVGVAEARVREDYYSRFDYAPPYDDDPVLDPILRDAAANAQHDSQAAVRWFRYLAQDPNMNIDPERIAVVGISAGGMTALAVNYVEEDNVGDSGNPGVPSGVRAAISLEGCAMYPDTIDAGDGPVLLVHNRDDPVVPYTCAEDTYDAALAAGASAVLEPRSNMSPPHGFTNYPSLAIDKVAEFLFDELVN